MLKSVSYDHNPTLVIILANKLSAFLYVPIIVSLFSAAASRTKLEVTDFSYLYFTLTFTYSVII